MAQAQRGRADLSEAEVEQLRDAAMDPAGRVLVFQKLIDARMERIQRVLTDVRAQGRAKDIHQNMDEVSGIVNELEDNLDEYASAHRDLRKSLPKLLSATERWQSILRQPPENEQYKLARTLALEAVADVKEDAAKLLPEQTQYFKEHPPSKAPEPDQYEVEKETPHRRDH
ncbi:hypothetical protein [Terriglobus aquaticus]|uniref:FlgN protein n=1 Tax=Terriglobus aquaticus TaxID=940139 RepID=A0ABW9KJE2_9BACT|nr:hypothetical protein [Terriglobus aquaticus]